MNIALSKNFSFFIELNKETDELCHSAMNLWRTVDHKQICSAAMNDHGNLLGSLTCEQSYAIDA